MSYKLTILLLTLILFTGSARAQESFAFDFYGDSVSFAYRLPDEKPISADSLTASVVDFLSRLEESDYQPVLNALLAYRVAHDPDDWIYYQLIRKAAGAVSPKAADYYRYTLVKCFLLGKSGYDVALARSGSRLFFFVRSDDEVYDIPAFREGRKRYVCLNFHDYGYVLGDEFGALKKLDLHMPGAQRPFSYQLRRLPAFRPENYHERKLFFEYGGIDYRFQIKINDEVRQLFINYPVTDYGMFLNSPLSRETYNSLIPQLRRNIAGRSTKEGIAYLMHFTRNAFPYATDQNHFGREKHLSPEQTLLYESSDCEDRAALFYSLVKELYNIPMVILVFPQHVTVAVQLEKPVGRQIRYNGRVYSVCEPTPQSEDLPIGSLPHAIRDAGYEVAYSYVPE